MDKHILTADILHARSTAQGLLKELEITNPMPEMSAYAESFMKFSYRAKLTIIQQGMQDVSVYGVKNPWTVLVYEFAKSMTKLYSTMLPAGVNLNTVEDQVYFFKTFPAPKIFERFYERFFMKDIEYLIGKYIKLVSAEPVVSFPWLVFSREYIAYLYLLGAKGEATLHVKGKPYFIVPEPSGKADLVDVVVALPQQVIITEVIYPANIICKVPRKPIEHKVDRKQLEAVLYDEYLTDTRVKVVPIQETAPVVSTSRVRVDSVLVKYLMDIEFPMRREFAFLDEYARRYNVGTKQMFRMIDYYKRKKAKFKKKILTFFNRGCHAIDCHYACLQYTEIVIREARAIHKFRKKIDSGDISLLSSRLLWRESTIGEPLRFTS